MPIHDLISQECMKKFEDGNLRMSKLEDTTNTLKEDMSEVKTAIIGDYEKPGLKTLATETAEHLRELRENKRDWGRWAERLVYSAMFGLIIYMIKQGLK